MDDMGHPDQTSRLRIYPPYPAVFGEKTTPILDLNLDKYKRVPCANEAATSEIGWIEMKRRGGRFCNLLPDSASIRRFSPWLPRRMNSLSLRGVLSTNQPQPAALSSSQIVLPEARPRVPAPRSAMRMSKLASTDVFAPARRQRRIASLTSGCACRWVSAGPVAVAGAWPPVADVNAVGTLEEPGAHVADGPA